MYKKKKKITEKKLLCELEVLGQRYTSVIINLKLRKTNSLNFNEFYWNTIIKFKRFSIWSLGSRNYLVLYSFKYLLFVAWCLKWRLWIWGIRSKGQSAANLKVLLQSVNLMWWHFFSFSFVLLCFVFFRGGGATQRQSSGKLSRCT